jgi:tRNA pseudouridine55 synthase
MEDLNGILIIDKPPGMTSHDVVEVIRRKIHYKKVGHGGTLDPLATGLLVILVGRATKQSSRFMASDKAYDSTMTLGIVTDTGDGAGKVIFESSEVNVTSDKIAETFSEFKGEIFQIPPMVSAIKYKGRKLYELAREGQVVERLPRKVHIHELEMVEFSPPKISFRVVCSRGTYIRALCEDIGKRLGCGAYLSQLRRIRVGHLTIRDAITVDAIGRMSEAEVLSALKNRIDLCNIC